MNLDKSIWVVIVTFNAENWIVKCLQSLSTNVDWKNVVVVDNCSSDGTIERVKNFQADCTVIESPTNLGFGQGNNLGIQYALAGGADFIFLLNQDAFIHPDCLDLLLEYANTHPEYGIIAPMILSYDGKLIDDYFLKWIFPYDPELTSDIIFQRPKKVYDVPLVPAAAWLLRREAIIDAGLFDPLFFMYCEDDDLWRRFKRKNWRAGFFPLAITYHYSSNANSFSIRTRKWLAYGNAILFFKDANKSFSGCLAEFIRKHFSGSLSAVIYLNKSDFYIRQITFFSILKRLRTIYQHRKLSESAGAFLNSTVKK